MSLKIKIIAVLLLVACPAMAGMKEMLLMYGAVANTTPSGCTLTEQDFTTYTASGGDLTVTASQISSVDSHNNEIIYVRQDFSADPFDEDFTVNFTVRVTNLQTWGIVVPFAMSSSTNNLKSQTGDMVVVQFRETSTTTRYLRLMVYENGTPLTDTSVSTLAEGSYYYCTLTREDSGGGNAAGRYTLDIYSDSNRSTLVDTVFVDSSAGEQNDFTHLFALDSWYDSGTSYAWYGYVYNYEVGHCVE